MNISIKKGIATCAFLVFVLIPSLVSAQTFEGKVVTKMEIQDAPPEMESMKSMMESTITTYTKGKKSRTETTNPMMGKMFIVMDMDKDELIMCMDMMGQKTAVVSTMQEYKDKSKSKGKKSPTYKETGETKMVSGYKCYKVLISMEGQDNKTMEMEMWYTKDIPNTNTDYPEISGMPLEYTITAQGMKMHFIATEISKEAVDESMFIIPAEYKRTTAEEMENKSKGK